MILNHHPNVDPKLYKGSIVWEKGTGHSPPLKDKYGEAALQLVLFIGYWASNSEPKTYKGIELPRPQDYIDPTWDPDERAKIVKYLEEAKVVEMWKGSSFCRICSKINGSYDLGDGSYIWPEGFAHYVECHGIKPPDEFIIHVQSKL